MLFRFEIMQEDGWRKRCNKNKNTHTHTHTKKNNHHKQQWMFSCFYFNAHLLADTLNCWGFFMNKNSRLFSPIFHLVAFSISSIYTHTHTHMQHTKYMILNCVDLHKLCKLKSNIKYNKVGLVSSVECKCLILLLCVFTFF